MGEKEEYKSNNELFEMISELKTLMQSLGRDLHDTQDKVKKYNGLREEIYNLKVKGCLKENEWKEMHNYISRMNNFMLKTETMDKNNKQNTERTLKIIAVITSVSSFLLALLLAMQSGG